jgi:hypothetical protein
MQRIWYSSSSFLTDDRVADAIMDYSRVLAIVDSADVIRVPAVDSEGVARHVQLLVGPASQIMAMPSSDDHVELDIEDSILELQRRMQQRLPDGSDLMGAGLDASDPLATEAPPSDEEVAAR